MKNFLNIPKWLLIPLLILFPITISITVIIVKYIKKKKLSLTNYSDINYTTTMNFEKRQQAIDLAVNFKIPNEGFSSVPYHDITQWSIGYGQFIAPISEDKPNVVWNQQQAIDGLKTWLSADYDKLQNLFSKLWEQMEFYQQAALLCFTHSLGFGSAQQLYEHFKNDGLVAWKYSKFYRNVIKNGHLVFDINTAKYRYRENSLWLNGTIMTPDDTANLDIQTFYS